MVMERMNRDEFYARLDALDEARLKKALWTLYWRSAAPVRERIEAETAPVVPAPRRSAKNGPPDPRRVLEEVRGFTALARAGSYMAGDRKVSPKERSGWRFTFRRLVADAQAALAAQECGPAQEAVADLVDLAVEVKSYDHFRSEDPMEAAGFVASDVVARLWGRMLELRGVTGLADHATEQLVRWESPYGWTRSGWGKVSEKETTLAVVLARLLRDPGAWVECADGYLRALDEVAQTDPGRARTSYSSVDYRRMDRARSLAEWNGMLLERLADYDAADRLDRIAEHPAFTGAEHRLFRAELARQRGETQRARELIEEGLAELPGHEELHDLAARTGAVVPERARAVMVRRGR